MEFQLDLEKLSINEKDELIRTSFKQVEILRTRLAKLEYHLERNITKKSLIEQYQFSTALNLISQSIIENDDPMPILDAVVNNMGNVLPIDRVLVYHILFDKQQAVALSEWLNPLHTDITPTKATYPLGAFIGGATEMLNTRTWITSHRNLINPHLREDGSGNILHYNMNIKSLLWYPFSFHENGFYILTLNQIHSDYEWRTEITDFLDSVAQLVSLALEKMRLVEDRKVSFYDSLTNLPNRRMLYDRWSQVIAVIKRTKSHAGIIFIDLDNFKPLNDTHGHMLGDMLLIEVANRLKCCVRELDTVVRYGGDEFLVLLSGLNADRNEAIAQAQLVAEKILTTLSTSYLLSASPDSQSNLPVEHRCTASIGIALFNDHQGSREEIIKWADTAMYQAKEAGRNQIRLYDSND